MPTIASQKSTPTDLDDMPAVMRVEDVASVLRIDVSTCYRLARAGEIPSFKVGRALRFSKSAVAAWLAGDPGEPEAVEA